MMGVQVSRDLASFQGPVSIVGGGYKFISANYASAPGDLLSPVAVSAGPSLNLMPIIKCAKCGKSPYVLHRGPLRIGSPIPERKCSNCGYDAGSQDEHQSNLDTQPN